MSLAVVISSIGLCVSIWILYLNKQKPSFKLLIKKKANDDWIFFSLMNTGTVTANSVQFYYKLPFSTNSIQNSRSDGFLYLNPKGTHPLGNAQILQYPLQGSISIEYARCKECNDFEGIFNFTIGNKEASFNKEFKLKLIK